MSTCNRGVVSLFVSLRCTFFVRQRDFVTLRHYLYCTVAENEWWWVDKARQDVLLYDTHVTQTDDTIYMTECSSNRRCSSDVGFKRFYFCLIGGRQEYMDGWVGTEIDWMQKRKAPWTNEKDNITHNDQSKTKCKEQNVTHTTAKQKRATTKDIISHI